MSNARILNLVLALVLLAVTIKFTIVQLKSPGDAVLLSSGTKLGNSTLETIYNRKSVRHFLDKPVSEQDLLELVRAGMAAPTAVNKQPWAFFIVRERQKLNKMAEQLPYAKMLKQAPAAIVVCGDTSKALDGEAQIYWLNDCSAASQNILLAAESMGLGAVWTATHPFEERMDVVKEELELPDHLIPMNVIPVGYPTGEDKAKDKWKAENVFFDSYTQGFDEITEKQADSVVQIAEGYQSWVSLTVAESKRLIAKGLLAYPPLKEKLQKGRVLLTKGSTNTYLAEELLKENIASGEYLLGHILPAKGEIKPDKSKNRDELFWQDGKIAEAPYVELIQRMEEGDIILKGANIINYSRQQAGVLIGHPTGGTTGNIMPVVEEKRVRLIIPVGLEKQSSYDLNMLSRQSKEKYNKLNKNTPYLWSLPGELFTEIEAIKQLANVDVFQIASGGIGGAEGAVSLCIRGNETEVQKALAAIQAVQGEAAYLEE